MTTLEVTLEMGLNALLVYAEERVTTLSAIRQERWDAYTAATQTRYLMTEAHGADDPRAKRWSTIADQRQALYNIACAKFDMASEYLATIRYHMPSENDD